MNRFLTSVIDERIEFPLRITYRDGSSGEVGSLADAAMNLEWFDSTDDAECVANIRDARGQLVDLVVEGLEVKSLRLRQL